MSARPKPISVAEFARRAGISRTTAWRMGISGRLDHCRTFNAGRQMRLDPAALADAGLIDRPAEAELPTISFCCTVHPIGALG